MRRISKLLVLGLVVVALAVPATARATTLLFDARLAATPDCIEPPSPCGAFTHFDITLSPTGWRVDNYVSGATPTISQFQTVLGSLSAFYILQDWQDDLLLPTTHVDNVTFGSGASNDFSTDNGGWSLAGTASPTSDLQGQPVTPLGPALWTGAAGFGAPAGSIYATDTFFGWNWFAAPGLYLGDQSLRFGETLSFDIHTTGTDDLSYPVIVLVGEDEPPVVPEPATMVLLGSGLAMGAVRRFRRRR